MSDNPTDELQKIYATRFAGNLTYRREVWRVLVGSFFQQYITPGDSLLDLGCGYGEFINTAHCARKFALDLNPDAPQFLSPEITLFLQTSDSRWPLDDAGLDVVFTSNFFEHLPDKETLGRTLDQAFRCLKPGGKLIAMGPNIKYLSGRYWDFWDHHLPLTELSLSEAISSRGFRIHRCVAKFLPYTMVNHPKYPLLFLRMYLSVPVLWRFFGEQFLLVATK